MITHGTGEQRSMQKLYPKFVFFPFFPALRIFKAEARVSERKKVGFKIFREYIGIDTVDEYDDNDDDDYVETGCRTKTNMQPNERK